MGKQSTRPIKLISCSQRLQITRQ